MTSRAVNLWRSVASRGGASRGLAMSTSTAADPIKNEKPYAKSLGERMPIYMIWGFVLLAVSFAMHTAKQQIVHNPSVRFNKKRREGVTEADDPNLALSEANKFITKSILRKVGHIQDMDAARSGITDPTQADPFKGERRAETLLSVGLDPRKT